MNPHTNEEREKHHHPKVQRDETKLVRDVERPEQNPSNEAMGTNQPSKGGQLKTPDDSLINVAN